MIAVSFWAGLGLFGMTLSYKLGLGKFNDPGPGLMPFLVSLLLFLVSIFFLVTLLVKKSDRCENSREERDGSNFWRVGLVAASLFIYALLFEKLGYLVGTLLLLIFLFRSVGYKWRFALINSILIVLTTYFLFTYLEVRFPPGFLKLGRFAR